MEEPSAVYTRVTLEANHKHIITTTPTTDTQGILAGAEAEGWIAIATDNAAYLGYSDIGRIFGFGTTAGSAWVSLLACVLFCRALECFDFYE